MKKDILPPLFITVCFFLIFDINAAELLYSGTRPENIYQLWESGYRNILTGNVTGKGRDCLLYAMDDTIYAYQYKEDDWQLLFSFFHERYAGRLAEVHDQQNSIDWTVGDIDGNGYDEIICINDSIISVHSWNKEEYNAEAYPVPFSSEQMISGDIDGDGKDELAVFCVKGEIEQYKWGKLELSIWKFKDDSFRKIWTDESALGYTYSFTIPPDFLQSMGKYGRDNKRYVIISKAQSDVSPTVYEFLKWTNNRLERIAQRNFIKPGAYYPAPAVRKDAVNRRNRKIESYKAHFGSSRLIPEYYICGHIDLVEYKKQDYILGQICGSTDNTGYALISIKYDLASSSWKIKQFFGGSWSQGLWMNIDGKGEGALLLLLCTDKDRFYQYDYVFYR